MNSLYQISADYQRAAQVLDDLGLDDETVSDTLESLSGDLEVKCENVAKFIQNSEATVDALKAAETRLSARRKSLEKRNDRMRDYLKSNMEACTIEKITCEYFQLSIKKNPPSVDIFDQAQIPPDYMTEPVAPPPAPDKKLIAKAIKDGFNVPGCKLVQGTRLSID